LLASRRPTREAAAPRIRELAERADLATLADALERRRLLPLLGTRLIDAGGAPADGPFADRVRAALARDRAAAMGRLAQTHDLTGRLGAAGIAALPLKGPSLAARVHGDVGLRSAGDVDLLVAPADLRRAVGLLCADGYAPPSATVDALDAAGRPRLHFTMEHARLAKVELHWRTYWYEERFSAGLLDRAAPGPEGLLVPHPPDEAAMLLLAACRDGFHGMRLAADLGAWWDRHGAEHGAAPLDRHLERHPELARPWAAAVVATGRVNGVPPGAWTSAPLRLDGRARLAVRLASWTGDGDRDQLSVNLGLVDGLVAPPGMLGRTVAYRAQEAPRGQTAGHLAKTAARSAVALWQVRREPWDPPTGAWGEGG
jgi:Uncharacterised nucleotidyltransferase